MEYNNTEILNVEQIFESEYVVPIYQRNFAWGEEQIFRLLQDICESIESNEQQYYIGSLVVIRRKNGEYEVIDGQQRLTTLALLSYVLHFNIQTKLHYDSRPEVENFLESIAAGLLITNIDSSVSHFLNAIKLLKEGIDKLEYEAKRENFRDQFSEFVRNHVCLVREVMPPDTDVASYFEIMNNRGEQLQEHEIVKGLLLEKIKSNPTLSQVCSTIWDACSQMDERIQKSFTKQMRISLFGDDYNKLVPTEDNYIEVFSNIQCSNSITEGIGLTDILKDDFTFDYISSVASNEEDVPEVNREESIIDFPNFLMHVMRLYYNDILSDDKEKEEIRLHDKYLLNTFRSIADKIDATEFIYRLLRCRTVFDRYVVKANFVNDDDEEGREWSLLKPKYYEYNKGGYTKSQLKYVNVFENYQDMIIKALSCIQVCHSSRYYKNYLQTILNWFKVGSIEIDENMFLHKLNNWILQDLNNNARFFGIKEYDSELQGTKISHVVLDYIDYLLWCIHVNKTSISGIEPEWNFIKKVKDFRFQYWNSVEHHYPQKRKEEMESEQVTDFDLNCLGNVFLVGKSTNSRMSDKNPMDKASIYGGNVNLAPNRQLIYDITNKYGWGKKEIENHLRFIETIFDYKDTILQNS